MIYAIVGTKKEIRDIAYKECSIHGPVSTHIYSEQIELLEPLIQASSLFEGNVVVNLIQCMDVSRSDAVVTSLLPQMKASSNIFIIDEPFADAHRIKKISAHAEKVFNALEEKSFKSAVFTLCDLFASRNKKETWLEWMKIRDKESGEAIQGLLWWKFQTVWSDVRAGKKAHYSLAECEYFGRKILQSSILAHRGEVDLKVELEKIILSI